MAKLRDTKGRFKKSNGAISKGDFQSLITNMRKSFSRVTNASLQSRNDLIDGILDPRRDIDDECGYPKTAEITIGDYTRLYDREGVATRVVEIFPKESWQVSPEVFETEEVDKITPFEEAFNQITSSIRGDSWHKDTEENPIWEYLLRIDILSGIGQYGVLLLGINDGKEMIEPVALNEKNELIFLRPLDQSMIEIAEIEKDETNPRFGQPVRYNIGFVDSSSLGGSRLLGTSQALQDKDVHWSRIIHIADNLKNSEIFGTPRMEPNYNRLYDLRKIYGANGETYWRNAVLKLFLETHPQLGPDVVLSKTEETDLKNAMEQMMNGLQQWMFLNGMGVKTVAPAVIDPTSHVDVHITAICMKDGIPKRVFMGTERGDLASSQDDATWNDRLRQRQNSHVTPRIIVPFTDRCITLGILPEPEEGYFVKWQDLNTLTDDQKATIAAKKTESLVKYVQGGGDALVSPIDYLTRFLDFSQEEATTIIETTMDRIAEEEEDNVSAGLNPDGTPIIEEGESEHLEDEKVEKITT